MMKMGQFIATCAGAALLASFATLATPKTAQAASLSFNDANGRWESSNPTEAVEKIFGIEIDDKTYNVT
ncbi:MAG: hypothetical protein F6K24_19545 [Okeania sp. SIO2D1]|nr:hypothetical protein [Okeania sp. SIO2D1]